MSDSVQPHRRQLTRLRRPWDSPGKNTGVGCHFLLQCMKVKSESEVTQSCLTLSDPMDCSPPGSSSYGFSRQEYGSGVPLPSPNELTVVTNFPTTHTLIVAGAGLGGPSCLLLTELYDVIEGCHANTAHYCLVGALLFDYSPSINHFKLSV